MATENQLRALEKWLKHEIPAGHDICEMPGEVCSDALSRLHEASELYKIDNSKKGIVLKVKQAIVSELQKDGYIDTRIGVDQTLDVEQDKIREERVLEAEAKAEAQRITEEQGRAPASTTIPLPAAEAEPAQPPAVKSTPATDSEIVNYYINLLAEITEKVEAEERIAEKERGYAISKVFDAITRDRRSELIAELNGGSHEEA